MAQEQSEASRYESRYGGGFISPAQFISEMMCERLAKKNKNDLPLKFWNTPKWKRTFMTTILAANGLLKIYHPKAIISALTKCHTVFSLRAPWLDDVIKQEQGKLDKFVEDMKVSTPIAISPAKQVNTTEKPREAFTTNKGGLNKLRGLDG